MVMSLKIDGIADKLLSLSERGRERVEKLRCDRQGHDEINSEVTWYCFAVNYDYDAGLTAVRCLMRL